MPVLRARRPRLPGQCAARTAGRRGRVQGPGGLAAEAQGLSQMPAVRGGGLRHQARPAALEAAARRRLLAAPRVLARQGPHPGAEHGPEPRRRVPELRAVAVEGVPVLQARLPRDLLGPTASHCPAAVLPVRVVECCRRLRREEIFEVERFRLGYPQRLRRVLLQVRAEQLVLAELEHRRHPALHVVDVGHPPVLVQAHLGREPARLELGELAALHLRVVRAE
mmetsp:Transcript_26251/g.74183  ORF Transcript_26251/g.74183 Transcript_26251/m.74183 type:complete len:223 (-) Transcript_26251:2091-2759(-)